MPESSSRSRSTVRSRITMLLLGGVMVAGVLVYSTAQYGFVHGVEFSPQSFKRRSFQFYEIPVVGFQVTAVRHTDVTGALEDYLVKDKIIQLPKPPQNRWDLVKAMRGFRSEDASISSFGEAQILCNYLDAADDADVKVWKRWSEKHTGEASYLWPIVVDLAQEHLYSFIPDLLRATNETDDLNDLKKLVAKSLTASFKRAAATQQALGRHPEAVELYTIGLRHVPADRQLFEQRAQCHSKLGDSEAARADRDRLRKLATE